MQQHNDTNSWTVNNNNEYIIFFCILDTCKHINLFGEVAFDIVVL